ncbi:MAG: thioredoxin [Muribaculaceae bacterium]|nr:thioredoxin [Muribaculaceae bacterium]MDE6757506.1 thioredoxin [Muribaculaceae bacterium]RXE72518.1 thioredoxin [Muribaculaceae bacterium Isolate-002 (NCI)]
MAFKFTDSNVEETIASGKPVVIDFWATWCGPCVGMAPIVDELAEEYADKAVIGKYNVDEEGEFASANRVMSLPTILFFKNGEKTSIRLVGSQSKDSLKSKIEELLAL